VESVSHRALRSRLIELHWRISDGDDVAVVLRYVTQSL
jgi:hypothetical protein